MNHLCVVCLGIACCNKLEEILLRGKDESYVAQKYIGMKVHA